MSWLESVSMLKGGREDEFVVIDDMLLEIDALDVGVETMLRLWFADHIGGTEV